MTAADLDATFASWVLHNNRKPSATLKSRIRQAMTAYADAASRRASFASVKPVPPQCAPPLGTSPLKPSSPSPVEASPAEPLSTVRMAKHSRSLTDIHAFTTQPPPPVVATTPSSPPTTRLTSNQTNIALASSTHSCVAAAGAPVEPDGQNSHANEESPNNASPRHKL